jgi:hypothetical protein
MLLSVEMYRLHDMSESGAIKTRRRGGGTRRSALLLLSLLTGAVGLALLAKGLYPVDLPPTRDLDFIDAIFHNRAVLWTARLLLVSAAVVLACGGFFIVISIGTRIKNGEWLRRAGPFEISETTLSEMERQRDSWRTAALLEQEKVIELTERLEESDELLEWFRTAFASGSTVGEDHP